MNIFGYLLEFLINWAPFLLLVWVIRYHQSHQRLLDKMCSHLSSIEYNVVRTPDTIALLQKEVETLKEFLMAQHTEDKRLSKGEDDES